MSRNSVNVNATPYLRLESFEDRGPETIPLNDRTCWTFGRSRDNDILLPDASVSRSHAMVQKLDNGRFYLIDLGSRNGSFVNKRRVTVPVILSDGDEIGLGHFRLHFYAPNALQVGGDEEEPPTECGTPELLSQTSAMQVRRNVSVLVTDIRDFTTLTRELGEERIGQLLRVWFDRTGSIIESRGGFVDKSIGDALMSFWIHEYEAQQARAIREILAGVDDIVGVARGMAREFSLTKPLRFGAALNTGSAVVGNTGTGTRPDYTVLGDTVNAAFRLETCNRPLGADLTLGRISHERFCQACGMLSSFQARHVQIKGYEEPVWVYAGRFEDLRRMLRPDEWDADDTVEPTFERE